MKNSRGSIIFLLIPIYLLVSSITTNSHSYAQGQMICQQNLERVKVRYSADHILLHTCERIRNSNEVFDIRLDNVKIFGVNSLTAIIYGNIYVVQLMEYPHLPTAFPFVIRTSNQGQTWTQVMDPLVDSSNLTDIRFIDATTGWLIWEHFSGDYNLGMFRTFNGGITWEPSEFHGLRCGNNVLVAWTFSSQWDGIAILDSHSCPATDAPNKEVAFWQMETSDGGKHWNVTKEILADMEHEFILSKIIPERTWLKSFPAWSMLNDEDKIIIRHTSGNIQPQPVLSLPKQLYESKQMKEYRLRTVE